MRDPNYFKEYRARQKAEAATIHAKLDRILQLLGDKAMVKPVVASQLYGRKPIEQSSVLRRCQARDCASLDAKARTVNGCSVWLCDEHAPAGVYQIMQSSERPPTPL